MIRFYYGFALLLLLASLTPVDAQHIVFEKGTWKDMLARAKNENKLVFVDVYASWCGPCKMLDQQVFTDKKVAATYNAFFLNYKIDAERGEGINLARQYNVRAYPTALFIDGNGQLIDSWVGFMPPPVFKQEGERVFRKTTLGLTLALHEAEYKEGNRNTAFMKTYLRLRQLAGIPSTDVLNDYVSQLPADSLQAPAIIGIVLANIATCNGSAFELMMNRKEEPRFLSAIQILLQNELSSAGKERDKAKFDALCRLVDRLEPADQVAERIAQYQLVYHAEAEDWKAYADQADAFTTRYLLPKLTAQAKQQQPGQFQACYEQLCNIGYFVSQHSKASTHLAPLLANLIAVGELNPTALNTSLQACVRYQLGKRDDAVALQTKAIELARAKGDDVSSYESTLLRMQKKKSL